MIPSRGGGGDLLELRHPDPAGAAGRGERDHGRDRRQGVRATGGGGAVRAAPRRALPGLPGMRPEARCCDLDHVIPWPSGPTDPTNLLTLVRRHHRMKHRTGWPVAMDARRDRDVDRPVRAGVHHPPGQPPRHPGADARASRSRYQRLEKARLSRDRSSPARRDGRRARVGRLGSTDDVEAAAGGCCRRRSACSAASATRATGRSAARSPLEHVLHLLDLLGAAFDDDAPGVPADRVVAVDLEGTAGFSRAADSFVPPRCGTPRCRGRRRG